MKRNFLATLMFSQGVRMLLGGDEIGRTQLGNNNGYCQDNEISWVDWDVDEHGEALRRFVADLIHIVASNPVLRRRDFFSGQPDGALTRDVTWIRSDGEEMTAQDWGDPENRAIEACSCTAGPRRRRDRHEGSPGGRRDAAPAPERGQPIGARGPCPSR